MATPNEKEDAEVYPVVILDPNGNDYTKGIAAWLTAIAEQNPKIWCASPVAPTPKSRSSPCTRSCGGKPRALSFPKLPDT